MLKKRIGEHIPTNIWSGLLNHAHATRSLTIPSMDLADSDLNLEPPIFSSEEHWGLKRQHQKSVVEVFGYAKRELNLTGLFRNDLKKPRFDQGPTLLLAFKKQPNQSRTCI